jgi:hypothetical protein
MAEIVEANLRDSIVLKPLPAGIPFQNFQTANPERLEFYIHVSILLQEDSMKKLRPKEKARHFTGPLDFMVP